MTVIPTPGNITNVAGIPEDLKAINQWIVWKPVLRGKKLTKVPVSYAFPTGDPVDAQDHMYWCSFAEAVEVMQRDPRFGIGFVLRGSGIVCIDYDDHDGDDAEAVARGREYMQLLATDRPTYIEHSVSGKGQHAFIRGELPHGRITGEIDHLNWEVYAQQFIAITGIKAIGSSSHVANGQDIIDAWRLPPPPEGAGAMLPTVALGRRLDYTDSEVISTMMVRRTSIFNMMSSQADLHDRSTAFAQIVGDLDKITGDPLQIDRIIRKCPFMKNGYNREKYDQLPKWLGKYNCANMLEYWMKQARQENTDCIPFAEVITPERMEFLKRVGDAIAYRTTVEAPAEVKEQAVSAAVTDVELSYDVHGDDPIAQLHFLLEDNIPGEYDKLTVPPGAVGDIVNALGSMLVGPRLTYALPAVISALSGYLGQTFKTPDFKMGLVNHFVIAGQMNTGKTSTMSVLCRAIDMALSGWYRNPNSPTNIMPEKDKPLVPYTRRVIETRAASVQGLFDAVSHLGSAVWFADEAETQIEIMSSSQPHGVALKAFYKQTFDQSQALASTSLDSSRASTNLGMTPILNMTLPTYFSCTSEVFENIGTKELVDGTYSRVNMIYDERPMDAEGMNGAKLHQGLPYKLAKLIQRIALLADDTARSYDQTGLATLMKETIGAKATKTKEDFRKQFEINKTNGAEKVVVMSMSIEAEKLHERISALCRRLGHDANPHIGKWPAHYQILARTDLLPVMIAGVLASCDAMQQWVNEVPTLSSVMTDDRGVEVPTDVRKSMPQVVVQRHHLQWAFEFVMHWRLNFFKAWDQGKIAVQMSDDEVVMERQVRRALNSKEALRVDNTVWVPEAYVIKQAKAVAPFKQADIAGRAAGRSGSTIMAKQTLDRMVSNGHVLRVKPSDIGLSKREPLVSLAKDY